MCQNDNKEFAASQRPVRILALGDSYTIGEGVSVDETWPAKLVHRLREKGWSVAIPVVVAKTGWTTDELLLGLNGVDLDKTYDLVFLLIGVNNQYRGRDREEYRSQFCVLLEKASDFTEGDPTRVIVLSIPDWSVTSFARSRDKEKIAREIDAFNSINLLESKKKGAQYVDVTLISRLAEENPSFLAGDGLHPSAAMYKEWVTILMPIVEVVLQDFSRLESEKSGKTT